MDFKNSLSAVLDLEELFSSDGICETLLEFDIGNIPEKPFIIISGDNASGKSFFCNALRTFLTKKDEEKGDKILVMDFSMNRRTTQNMSRIFIYGSEADQSTGELSLHSIVGAIKNSKEYDTKHAIIFDEPDIGLSEAFIPPLGKYIAQYYRELPENAKGIVLVTHNRLLVKELMEINPVTIRIGTQQSTLDWIKNGSPEKTIDDLINLKDVSFKKYGQIQKFLSEKRAEKNKANGA